MIILQGDPSKMDYLMWEHTQRGKTFKVFEEEDLGNIITAVAFEPTDNYKLFKKYKLL